jgi:CHASE2 domain-containing sensor protein/signal transduction histidine kinase
MTVNPVNVKQSRSRLRTWLGMNLLLLSLVAGLSLTFPVEELSRRLGDIYFRLRPPLPTSDSVALVLIDDLSLGREGRWPWPRSLLARLLRATAAQKPAAIGLDILLTEAENPADDSDLAKAIGEAGNVVISAKLGDAPRRLWVDPLALFLAQSAALGHVQAVEEADGICRNIPLLELSVDGPRWALAVQAAAVAKHRTPKLDPDGLLLGNELVWRTGGFRINESTGWKSYARVLMPINFRQQYSAGQQTPPFVVISASELLHGNPEPALGGKLVLIGFGATELSDRLPTPVSGQMPMPGVEVHANLADSVLSGRTLRRVGSLPQALILILFMLISTALALRWPGWTSVLLQALLLCFTFAAGYLLFAYAYRTIDLGPILCGGILAVPLAQLENLLVLNRGLTRGLELLRQVLPYVKKPSGPNTLESVQTATDDSGDLARRMDVINELQAELASHYVFRQHLLESMQEGLAVFSGNGKMLFRNPFWDNFCRKEGWDPEIDLADFCRLLGHPNWINAPEQMRVAGLPKESEVYLGGGFWQVRGVSLSATREDDAPQWMVVVNDLTLRLERDQARAEALRFVTHELRTPLVSIQGFAEFLLRHPKAAASSDAAATIFRESQRLVSLINTYLDVLRYDAGARSMRREPLRIGEMMTQLGTVISPIAEAAEVSIEVVMDDELPQLSGDAAMLNGVFLNLLNNAVKYSPAGSVVRLRVTGTHGAAIFEVCNPGPPIPLEDMAHLFEPFYRAKGTDESAPGWGLGLTFVKRIVDEHRGMIEASSEGDLIRIRVILPADDTLAEARNANPAPVSATGSNGPTG